MKRNPTYVLLILLVLVIAAASVMLLLNRSAPPEPSPTPAPPTDPVPTAPAPTLPEPSPSPTPEFIIPVTTPPVFETRPPIETEPPEETPEPVATPTPESEGTLRSDTGVGLNISAKWYTRGDGKLHVDVSCLSYSIYSAAQWQSVVLTLGDETYKSDSKAVSYDGKDLISSPLASFTVDAPANGTPISVTWNYRGKYSGKDLEAIGATGTIVY